MALTRNVNGKVVELTPEEEAAVRAQWAANDAARAEEEARPKPPPLEQRLATLESEVAALKAARAPAAR